MTTDDIARERDMVMNPDAWPAWPRLPLIRREGVVQRLGVLVNQDLNGNTALPLRVYIGNMFMPLDSMNVQTYDTFEAMYEAGWRVD